MHGAFDALTTLVWLTAAPLKPEKVEDAKRELTVIEAAPHVFDGTAAAKEPALAAIGSLLSSYAAQTRSRLERGERDTIGFRVRTLASLCLACHSREQVAMDFADQEKRFTQLSLAPLERARVLSATRQFEPALKVYRSLLSTPDGTQALDESLLILVRAKNDADGTAALLRAAPPSKRVSELQAEVEAWRAEKSPLATMPLDALLTRCAELIESGKGLSVLRALGALTTALSRNPTPAQRGQMLWLLGLGSGQITTPALWDLDLLYLEACVRENTRTPLAAKCFTRFEERLTLGFTGSGGTRIPPDETKRLEALRAQVK